MSIYSAIDNIMVPDFIVKRAGSFRAGLRFPENAPERGLCPDLLSFQFTDGTISNINSFGDDPLKTE